jgi:hypothetical protein
VRQSRSRPQRATNSWEAIRPDAHAAAKAYHRQLSIRGNLCRDNRYCAIKLILARHKLDAMDNSPLHPDTLEHIMQQSLSQPLLLKGRASSSRSSGTATTPNRHLYSISR